jgi:hypothetical protein
MRNKKVKNIFKFLCVIFLTSHLSPLTSNFAAYAAMPSSTNYKLQDFTFGSGGADNATSTNYKLHGVAGEVEFGQSSSTNYKAGLGLTFMEMANLPPAPTFTNPDNYYNKLKIVIATGSNPSDAQFAIAISPDNFSTITKYVQADTTIGNSPVWQTYTAWGGASGTTIIGLTPGTTYTAKVAARQGNFTQSGYGPTAQVATITPTLSMTLSPNTVNIGQLTPGSVVTSGTQVTTTLTTNGTGGAAVYVYGTNGGLLSSSVNYTITAVSSDLSGASEGYGLRAVSTTESSGGPMQKVSPYNGSGDNVGVVDTNKRPLFDSSGQPVTSGQGIFELKAKASSLTKAASDYADVITVIASATF